MRSALFRLAILLGVLVGFVWADSLVSAAPPLPTTRPSKTVRAYHIGNSVTDTIRYNALAKLSLVRGNRYVFGRYTIPGCPLWGLYADQKNGFIEKPFGPSQAALSNFDWDVVTLQPFDRLLDRDLEPDLISCEKFIELIVARNPNTQVYIYSRWPRRDEVKGATPVQYLPLDFAAKWEKPYSGKWDQSFEARDYFQTLAAALNQKFEGKLAVPIKVMPVGEVLFELDKRIRAGHVPGVARIDEIYADHIHLTDVGAYAAGATFYAEMFNEPAAGLPSQPYGKIDPAVAKVVQECVDTVLSSAGR